MDSKLKLYLRNYLLTKSSASFNLFAHQLVCIIEGSVWTQGQYRQVWDEIFQETERISKCRDSMRLTLSSNDTQRSVS